MSRGVPRYWVRRLGVLALVVPIVGGLGFVANRVWPSSPSSTTASSSPTVRGRSVPTDTTVPPEANIYGHIGPNGLSKAVAGDPARVYVPNSLSNTVSVIDQATRRVVDTFKTGREPQHIIPSFDLRTLWVVDNAGNAVVPIDPSTGRLGAAIPVEDPYNLYFTPDGSSAIVVAEAKRRLDFRDPHTMKLTSSIHVPECEGINHADYDATFTYLIVTCEFNGRLAKIDLAERRVVGMLDLTGGKLSGRPPNAPAPMPQDVRAGPDGHHFYVADMRGGGVYVLDGDRFKATKFIPTGIGAHGITPSRDGSVLYIANRGSDTIGGRAHGAGSVSVLDPADDRVTATWPVPGGGSPDMGNLNVDGTELWLAGRYDAEVYVFDTVHGALAARIPVGAGPHGLTVWPQPGRFSLGHTGNMR